LAGTPLQRRRLESGQTIWALAGIPLLPLLLGEDKPRLALQVEGRIGVAILKMSAQHTPPLACRRPRGRSRRGAGGLRPRATRKFSNKFVLFLRVFVISRSYSPPIFSASSAPPRVLLSPLPLLTVARFLSFCSSLLRQRSVCHHHIPHHLVSRPDFSSPLSISASARPARLSLYTSPSFLPLPAFLPSVCPYIHTSLALSQLSLPRALAFLVHPSLLSHPSCPPAPLLRSRSRSVLSPPHPLPPPPPPVPIPRLPAYLYTLPTISRPFFLGSHSSLLPARSFAAAYTPHFPHSPHSTPTPSPSASHRFARFWTACARAFPPFSLFPPVPSSFLSSRAPVHPFPIRLHSALSFLRPLALLFSLPGSHTLAFFSSTPLFVVFSALRFALPVLELGFARIFPPLSPSYRPSLLSSGARARPLHPLFCSSHSPPIPPPLARVILSTPSFTFIFAPSFTFLRFRFSIYPHSLLTPTHSCPPKPSLASTASRCRGEADEVLAAGIGRWARGSRMW
ncbi:hypothetical protein C8J57DRAFT_1563986, partial [Mycena rebaudengoi]